MSDEAGTKKFEGFASIGRAFEFVFGNLPHLILTSIPTLLVICLFNLGLSYLFLEDFLNIFSTMMDAANSENFALVFSSYGQIWLSPMISLSMLVAIVFGGMFAIRWHRSALFGADSEKTGLGFEFSASLGSYIWRGILIYLIVLASVFVSVLAFSILAGILGGLLGAIFGEAAAIISIILIAIPGLAAMFLLPLYLFCRLSLALPAAALEIFDFGLRKSWAATKGNVWPIIGLYVVVALIVVVVSMIVTMIVGMVMSPLFGPVDFSTMFDLDASFDVMIQSIRRDIWVQNVSSFIVLPISYSLVTSLFSYIYFQLGQPPQWVDDKTISMDD